MLSTQEEGHPYPRLMGRFMGLAARRGVDVDPWIQAFVMLANCYQEPWRHYHTLEHIEYCLNVFDRFRRLAQQPDLVELAIYYHDVIYEIGVPPRQNEERSAELARSTFWDLGLKYGEANVVAQLILATTHDHVPWASDDKLIVDIDLAALGADWPTFVCNNWNVREEYRAIPEDTFRAVNSAILKQFFDRSPLYYHPEIEAEFGAQAKRNLRRWLDRP